MRRDILDLWPNAPITEADPDGRWVRFALPDGRVTYIQRYAWDESSRADYLVVTHDGNEPGQQERYGHLEEAVARVRNLLASPQPLGQVPAEPTGIESVL